MRRLTKGPTPRILVEKGKLWTAAYLAARKNPPVPRTIDLRYQHHEIKEAVVLECFGKCAYCESKIRHVAPGDIEHILPSSRVPRKHFEWPNLTLGCPECNRHKLAYYDTQLPLLNPYTDDVETLLLHIGPFVSPRDAAADKRPLATILKIGFNTRKELWARKMERLETISKAFQLYSNEPKGPLKKLLLRALEDEAGPDSEYSAMAASAISALLTP